MYYLQVNRLTHVGKIRISNIFDDHRFIIGSKIDL